MIMSLSSCGTGTLDISGPKGLATYCEGVKSFVRRKYPEIQIHQHESDANGEFHVKDSHLDIFPLAYTAETTDSVSCSMCRFPHQVVETISSRKEETTTADPWLKRFYQAYEPGKIPQIPSILHRFPNRKELQQRLATKYRLTLEQVENPPEIEQESTQEHEMKRSKCQQVLKIAKEPKARTIVEPSSVIGYMIRLHYEPCPIIWIIDCPSMNFIAKTIEFFPPCAQHLPETIVHMTPVSVMRDSKYWEWLQLFPSTTNHLIFDGDALISADANEFYGVNFTAGMKQLLKLNAEMPQNFPLSDQLSNLPKIQTNGLILSSTQDLIVRCATPRLEYCVLGYKTPRTSCLGGYLDHSTATFNVPKVSDVALSLPAALFLGTGSAAPSRLRSSSGIYLRLSENFDHGVLLDAGEGCFGQLWRSFGSKLPQVLQRLCCIWISHHHADHHAGILKLLQEMNRYRCVGRRLRLIAPASVLNYITSCQSVVPLDLNSVDMSTNKDFNVAAPASLQRMSERIKSLTSVRVFHCFDSYGVVLELTNGFRIVYSGDTRPCDQLIRAGFKTDVLIHEATFDSTMIDDAIKKKHSTVDEAVEVGRKMQAKKVILTHFSQRYPSLPPENTHTSSRMAYDNMWLEM